MPPWTVQGHSSPIRNPTRPSSSHDSMSRKRIPLACEACYKKKIKCEVDGSHTACIPCIRRDITCKFPSRREKRDNLKRTHYVKNLEDRLQKMESLLKAAGLTNDDTIPPTDRDNHPDEESESESESDDEPYDSYPEFSRHNSDDSRLHTARNSGSSSSKDFVESTSNANRNSTAPAPSLATNPPERKCSQPSSNGLQRPAVFKWDNREDSRYYGRSSFLSILSRDGIEWIKNKTGEVKFLNLVFSDNNRDSPWDYWRPDVFHDVFSSRVFKALPPRAEVFTLLRQYFRTVNRLFPLYHEASFMRLVEWQYTQQTCDDAARWASINIILSLAYEYRFSNSQKSERDREKAWLYFKNAMSVFTELTLRRTDILSVQALLGMALFLRGNSGTQSSLPLITAAIRSCHRMGMHRNIPRPSLSQEEQEQRKRVFWIAYVLDQSVCIRSGNAPTQHPDDLDIGLPSRSPEDEFIMSSNSSFFYQICHMTVIKGRIYGRLYSAKALHNKSPTEVLEIVRELHQDLEEWKNASAFSQQLKQRGSGDDFLVGFATAGLQCLYYNSLIMIHRLPQIIHFAYSHRLASGAHMRFDYKTILSESSASTAICVQAARDTLKLVNNLPWGDVAWIWSLLYYVFLAVMTIFVNILRDSRHPKAKEDLQSLNMAATFFATLLPADGSCNYARFMTQMCANFERVARTVYERDQKSVVKPTGNKPVHDPEQSGMQDQPSSSSTTTTTTTHQQLPTAPPTSSTGLDIPHLEGLPRINSSGYVVPDGLSDTEEYMHNMAGNDPSSLLHPPQAMDTDAHQPPHHHAPYQIQDNILPISVTETFSQPELWQIPLTADWEFGGQLLNGLFGPNVYYPENPPAAPPPTTTTMAQASGHLPFGFMSQPDPQGTQGHPPQWPDGSFMNPYY
ncbi:hypothetical protein FE257_001226 [Aspergillus nanangensis]|uniref:Zn(2)-C6 fungal-type domain-containing protein n=1 Tax=Aspergillus nanangensis TaxID=2582783 RepID=A0AAD4CE56_ASPNN|nr:hypothetical protein FE257_001226 [Aspergillus nanangensis]